MPNRVSLPSIAAPANPGAVPAPLSSNAVSAVSESTKIVAMVARIV